MALLRAEAYSRDGVQQFLQNIKQNMAQHNFSVHLLGPIPAPLERKKNRYRSQLLLQADRRNMLHLALEKLTALLAKATRTEKLRWSLDVDPQEIVLAMTMDRFAVIGDPVSHSLSPYIHQAFAAQQSMKITYEKIRVTNDAFKETVLAFQAAGFKGINITQPHKEKAYQLADDIMPHAGLSKAVNTLTFADSIIGDNTDGLGLVIDLQHNLHISLQDKRILVFGAGGVVARGIIPSLLTEKPAELCLVNRTAAKAKSINGRICNIRADKGNTTR